MSNEPAADRWARVRRIGCGLLLIAMLAAVAYSAIARVLE